LAQGSGFEQGMAAVPDHAASATSMQTDGALVPTVVPGGATMTLVAVAAGAHDENARLRNQRSSSADKDGASNSQAVEFTDIRAFEPSPAGTPRQAVSPEVLLQRKWRKQLSQRHFERIRAEKEETQAVAAAALCVQSAMRGNLARRHAAHTRAGSTIQRSYKRLLILRREAEERAAS